MPEERRPNDLKILHPLPRRRSAARITGRALAFALALSVTLVSVPVIPDVWAFTANGPGMIHPISTKGTVAEQQLLAELSMFNISDVASHVLYRQVRDPLSTSTLRPPAARRLLLRDRNKTDILALALAIATWNVLGLFPSPVFLPLSSALAFPGIFMACVTISAWLIFQPTLYTAIHKTPQTHRHSARLASIENVERAPSPTDVQYQPDNR